jgi:hypothetical protein
VVNAVRPVRVLVNTPVPVPVFVKTLDKVLDKVGLVDVLYTTPLSTIRPPSDDTFPPVVAPDDVIFVIGDVVT